MVITLSDEELDLSLQVVYRDLIGQGTEESAVQVRIGLCHHLMLASADVVLLCDEHHQATRGTLVMCALLAAAAPCGLHHSAQGPVWHHLRQAEVRTLGPTLCVLLILLMTFSWPKP